MIQHGYKVWFNGAVVTETEARVSASSRAAMYGDGCFETLLAASGKFVCWTEHIDRLHAGMKYLGIQKIASLEPAALKKSVLRLIEINRLESIDSKVRIQVWRSGISGMDDPLEQEATAHISVKPAMAGREPLRLIVAKTRRVPAAALDTRFKLSNYLNYILACREAIAEDADDALMLTVSGNVSESSVANIFWLKNGVVYTPSLLCDPLHGITRMLTIRHLKSEGRDVVEGEFVPSDLEGADAVWVCNSVRIWQPVKSIGRMEFTVSAAQYRSMHDAFKTYLDTIKA
jgi:branched-subunit amino acid aminotransferase/4-amino-4-deoxychorismate lyase